MRPIDIPPHNICRRACEARTVQDTYRVLNEYYQVPMPVVHIPEKGMIWDSFMHNGTQVLDGSHSAGNIWLTNTPSNDTIFHEYFHYLLWYSQRSPFGYDFGKPHDERSEEIFAAAFASEIIKLGGS